MPQGAKGAFPERPSDPAPPGTLKGPLGLPAPGKTGAGVLKGGEAAPNPSLPWVIRGGDPGAPPGKDGSIPASKSPPRTRSTTSRES